MTACHSWQCVSSCGACCRLDPAQRGEALEALSAQEKAQYLEMVGPDGWCVHYDTGSRSCRIYSDRPNFCRVDQLAQRFGVAAQHQDAFAIDCCRQQIRVEYGGRSLEMRRFERAIRNNTGDGGSSSGQ